MLRQRLTASSAKCKWESNSCNVVFTMQVVEHSFNELYTELYAHFIFTTLLRMTYLKVK